MLSNLYRYYHEDEGCTRESLELDQKIGGIVSRIDFNRAVEDDYMFNLFSEAVGYGEEKGFADGFKYAVQLFSCCRR